MPSNVPEAFSDPLSQSLPAHQLRKVKNEAAKCVFDKRMFQGSSLTDEDAAEKDYFEIMNNMQDDKPKVSS